MGANFCWTRTHTLYKQSRFLLLLPLAIGEPKPLPFDLVLKNTVLFVEIVGDRLLTAVKPAGQGDYQGMERLYGVCHCTNRLSTILFDNNIIQFFRIFAPYGISSHGVSSVLAYRRGISMVLPCVACSTGPSLRKVFHTISVRTTIRFFVIIDGKPTYGFLRSRQSRPSRIPLYRIPSLSD